MLGLPHGSAAMGYSLLSAVVPVAHFAPTYDQASSSVALVEHFGKRLNSWATQQWPKVLQRILDAGAPGEQLAAADRSVLDGVGRIGRAPTVVYDDEDEVELTWQKGNLILSINVLPQGDVEWFYSYGNKRSDYAAGDGDGWHHYTKHLVQA